MCLKDLLEWLCEINVECLSVTVLMSICQHMLLFLLTDDDKGAPDTAPADPPAQKQLMFASVGGGDAMQSSAIKFEEIQRQNATFVASKSSKSTIKKPKATVNRFMDWARGKGEMRQLRDVPPEQLDQLLALWFVDLKQANGKDYEPNSLDSYFHSWGWRVTGSAPGNWFGAGKLGQGSSWEQLVGSRVLFVYSYAIQWMRGPYWGCVQNVRLKMRLGPRWGQKSLDLRSRDFCPHREPRGELIAQYLPPMSFRYIIFLIIIIIIVIKSDNSEKHHIYYPARRVIGRQIWPAEVTRQIWGIW